MSKKSFLSRYYPQTTEETTINNRNVVEVFSNAEEEYNHLRNEFGLVDLSEYGIFSIEGKDAELFVDRLATKDIAYLNIGQLSECYFLDEDGRILSLVNICKFDDRLLVLTPWESAEETCQWLLKNQEGFQETKIIDLNQTYGLLSIEGPKSGLFIKNHFHFDTDTLPLRSFLEIEYMENKMTLIRNGFSGEFGYMLFADKNTLELLFDDFSSRGYMQKLCGSTAMDLTMLEIRQPNLRTEKKEFGSIFELCRQWLVQYDKEDYIGHTAVLNEFQKQAEKKTIGFSLHEDCDVPHGSRVFAADKEIGKILFSRYSYKLNQRIGLLLVDSLFAASGLSLLLENDSRRIAIQTISSPYLRPDSWDIISGIEE